MNKKIFLSLFLLWGTLFVRAAKVDTVMVESSAMNKVVEVIYIAPERHTGNLPVVYLLHGYGNSGKDWLAFKPDLRELADSYKIMFVCPDGKNSWYWDSPKDPSSKYETFVSKELIEYTFYVPGQHADTEGRILEVNQQVESIAEAEKLAKKSLRNKNKDEVTASLSIPGGYEFAAGCVYKLTGWQKFDGNYICEKVSHSIGGGYSVSLELRRVLNGY